VPIVVAINKIDKANANPERVKRELTDLNLMPEEWGGQTVTVDVSAKKKQKHRAAARNDPARQRHRRAEGEPQSATRPAPSSRRSSTKGADRWRPCWCRDGTLSVGDTFIAGPIVGRVRALIDDRGRAHEVRGAVHARGGCLV